MKDFRQRMLEIVASDSNAKLQLAFYDLQSYLVHSVSTPEVISRIKIQTTLELFAEASVEVCEELNKALEEYEENE